MNNLTSIVMATLVAAFAFDSTSALAQSEASPHPEEEGTHPHKGVAARLRFDYYGMLPSDLTRANLIGGGAGVSYTFRFPLSLDVDGGVISVIRGGNARHYTQAADGRTTGYLSLGVSYLPRFTDHVGMRIRPKGFLLFNNGGGAMLDIGSMYYIGDFQPELGVSVGYLNWGSPVGDNPTAPRLEDPILHGLTLGLYVGVGYKFK